VRAAAAQVARQGFFYLAIGGFRILIEQCFRRHDHAIDAIPALHRLFVNKGLLNPVHLFSRTQAFEGSDGLILGGRQRRNARADGVTVHDDGAGAALRQTAAEFGAVKLQVVAQGIEQRHVRFGVNDLGLAIHFE